MGKMSAVTKNNRTYCNGTGRPGLVDSVSAALDMTRRKGTFRGRTALAISSP